MKRYIKLIEILRKDKKLAECVMKVQKLDLKKNITEGVNALNFDFATHLFIMGNYSDLMNIKIEL